MGMKINACAYVGDPVNADDPGLWQDMTVGRSEARNGSSLGEQLAVIPPHDRVPSYRQNAAEVGRGWHKPAGAVPVTRGWPVRVALSLTRK
jgi:hypothetical protein